eukprot:scaffold17027_cov106-Amphora_coffeaeformis.AAC.4
MTAGRWRGRSAARSAMAAGEAIEVPEKGGAAALKGRTNVANRRWSSGQKVEGLGGRRAGGGRRGTASTVSTSTRKGSSAGAGRVKAMEKG